MWNEITKILVVYVLGFAIVLGLGYYYLEHVLTITIVEEVGGVETKKTMSGWEWVKEVDVNHE